MSTPSISFSGLASGIDSAGIIAQLTTVAQKPVKLLQGKDDTYNASLAAWQQFNSALSSLQSSVTTLSQPATFNTASATSSVPAVATITTLPGATIGDHSLSVTQLASAQKVVSASVTSGSTALGKAGSFTLNGKTVAISSTDALTDIAVKINAAQTGVSATVVNVGPNDFRLTLTSHLSGTANTIAASDITGGVLGGLGVLGSGASTARSAVSFTQNGTAYTGAASLTLASATQSVGSLLGIQSGQAASGTFHLSNGGTGTGNEADIAINLNTASLTDVANAINQAGITGVSAEVVTIPDVNGNLGRIHQLEIVNKGSTAPTFTDPNGVLGTLGVLQAPYTQTASAAKDAKFNLDGLDLVRSSNTIGDVIPGATVKLLSGTVATPGVTDLNVSQNTDTVVQAVTSLATAYNAIQDFVTSENKFTPPTDSKAGVAGTNAPLFGDTTLSQVQDQLSRALTAVSGNTTLESIGITMGQDGKLTVDSTALTTVLQTDPSKVSNLFSASGTTDGSAVTFVSASPKTVATSGVGYTVNITRPATQSVGVASTATTPGGISSAPETLSFTGALFPAGIKLTLPVGSTLQDTVSLINNTSSLNSSIYASVDSSNHLVLSSQRYGSGNSFTVNSDSAATSTNSGVGPALSVSTGLDVTGTINGEPATGTGRTLSGNSGNATTEGLQLLVSATAASGATPNHVAVTHGVADSLSQTLTQLLDPINGAVAGAEAGINSQISDTQSQIAQIQASVSTYTDYLTQLFSQMETRISVLQAQGNAFNAQVGNSNNSSSNSGTLKSG